MEQFNIIIPVTVCAISELSEPERQLVESAMEIRKNSYSPFSGFRVGAAVLLSNGLIITGSNQENEAYPSGLCAERVAVFYANSQYHDSAIVAIAITSVSANGSDNLQTASGFTSPCGACRQALLQSERRFGNRIKVLMPAAETVQIVDSIEDLLPLGFKI